jgi:hypothetical protein
VSCSLAISQKNGSWDTAECCIAGCALKIRIQWYHRRSHLTAGGRRNKTLHTYSTCRQSSLWSVKKARLERGGRWKGPEKEFSDGGRYDI